MNAITLAESLLQKITALERLIEKQSDLIQAQALRIEEQAETIVRLQSRIAELEKRTKKIVATALNLPLVMGYQNLHVPPHYVKTVKIKVTVNLVTKVKHLNKPLTRILLHDTH